MPNDKMDLIPRLLGNPCLAGQDRPEATLCRSEAINRASIFRDA